jgi:hypothetical protein
MMDQQQQPANIMSGQPTAPGLPFIMPTVMPMVNPAAISTTLTAFLASLPAKHLFAGPAIPADIVIRYIMQASLHYIRECSADGVMV